jgi:PASTA domain-containing protein
MEPLRSQSYRDRAMDLFDALSSVADLNFLDWVLGPIDGGEGGRRLPRKGTVPEVRGLDVAEARDALRAEGFKGTVKQLEKNPAPVMGVVIDQFPSPGVRWNRAKPIPMDVKHPKAIRKASGP